jgi:hypothetical protein
VIECPEAVAAATAAATVRIEAEKGLVEVDGASFEVPPLPPFVIDMIRGGGLIPWVRSRL